MSEPAFDISVVTPTRDRWPRLRRMVTELAGQHLDGVSCELVVVDNGSRDGSGQRLQQLAGGLPLPLTVVYEPRPGATVARNAGIRAARGELVLFFDDDCRPALLDLVRGHVEAHRDNGDAAVLGRVDWDPEIEVTPVMDWLVRSGRWYEFDRLERKPPGAHAFYSTNISLPRSSLLEVGGFDERFPIYYEDLDLGLRLADRGLQVRYRPELAAFHAHEIDLEESLQRAEAVGRSANLLNRIHAHRAPLPAPHPAGIKADVGRAMARLSRHASRVGAGAGRAGDVVLRGAHFSAFALGYLTRPLPDSPALAPRPEGRPPARPSVSVIVPFAGERSAADAALRRLGELRLRAGDEVVVADNSGGRVPEEGAQVRVVDASATRSAYFARNVGAEAARGAWLLFVDADCAPSKDLLDDYFSEPIPDAQGIVAGNIVGAPEQRGWVARYARSRRHQSPDALLRHPFRPFGITGNLLVRRAAWAQVGGFHEGVRSGGDVDFSWRVQAAGWTLGYRGAAWVEHGLPESLRTLLRQAVRYGAGHAWLNRRHPGSFPPPRGPGGIARGALGALVWSLTGRLERATFKATDAAVIAARDVGYLFSNGRRPSPRPADTESLLQMAVLVDSFPEISETFVTTEAHALVREGLRPTVVAGRRADRPSYPGARGLPVHYLDDDGLARKAADLAWLLSRHPGRCVADVTNRRRWRRHEPVRPLRSLAPAARRISTSGTRHLHAHFAMSAALDALRLGRILGIPYSVTAHAFDIYREPRNLGEKLERASFATSGCDYTVRDLRRIAGADAAGRIHKIVMGVDGARFPGRPAAPGGRHVIAVGRLVEKKGFGVLIAAAALLERRAPLEQVTIVGAGPLREQLERQAERSGLAERVTFTGARTPEEIQELLGKADVLAAPCVIAADGDRDSMPVVVKEALAMEVPVVASDEVGLPEMIRPEWGRLVPPGDADALARALQELLAVEPGERERMGRAGRRFVLDVFSAGAEARKLAQLIRQAAGS